MAVSKLSHRAALRLSSASLILAVACAAAPAYAQDASVDSAEADGTEIVVTGSRIARRDIASASPLVIVGAEEFKLSGATNVENVVNTLPQVSAAGTAFSNNPGNGVATLDLRHLGETRTLVLVNGRRYMFYGTDQVVDLNTIPSFLINSVDVVTGGASAVYGSDAVGGVVNFRLRQVQGVEVGGQYNVTSRGDAPRYSMNIAAGTEFAGGRGKITAYGEYSERSSLFQDARDVSSMPVAENAAKTDLVFAGSSFVPQGRFSVGSTVAVPGGNGLGATTMTRGVGNFAQGLGSFYTAPGVSRPYDAATDAYNFASETYLMVPQKRYLAGAFGEFEVSSAFKPYFEGSYIRNEVKTVLAPTIFAGDFKVRTDIPGLSDADRTSLLQIDANEAAIDAARVARGLTAAYNDPGQVTLTFARRAPEAGPRLATNTREAYRFLVGATGAITNKINYDVYYSWAKTTNRQHQTGNVSISAFQNLLNQNLVNPFGAGTLTAANIAAVSVDTNNRIESKLQVASAAVSGSVFNLGLGADDIGFAVGTEWREVSSSYSPDAALSSGDLLGFSTGQPTKGKYNVKEVFGELRIPLLADRPFFERLELNGAARYSDYSLGAVGSVFTYAAGAEWAPVRDIAFRGQVQRAIRAPNVEELFGGQVNGVAAANDPCSDRTPANQTAAVRALCVATGVPAALVFTGGVQPNSQIEQLTGGNPDLQEERSDTYTFGTVVRPSFIPRLTITADYFNIKVEDQIAQAGGGTNSVLNLCYNVIQDAASSICQAITRNPTNGQILAPSRVDVRTANIGTLKTAGVDVQVDYTLPLAFGLASNDSRLGFNFFGTWTDKFSRTPIADLPAQTYECAGYYGATCRAPLPKYKFTTRLTWMDGPLTTSVRMRYLSAVKDDRISVSNTAVSAIVVAKVNAQYYFDLSAAIQVAERFTLSMGMNNVFDRKAPLIGGTSAEQSGTWPGTYDILGRDLFVSASVRF